MSEQILSKLDTCEYSGYLNKDEVLKFCSIEEQGIPAKAIKSFLTESSYFKCIEVEDAEGCYKICQRDLIMALKKH